MNNLLVADIGNTHVHFGMVRDRRIVREFKIRTASLGSGYLKKLFGNCCKIVACSVVPAVEYLFRTAAQNRGVQLAFAGEELPIPLKNNYKNPGAVGKDRLVNCYAALNIDRGVRMVVDFGTALTFDFISGNKEYSGGAIVPGMRLSLDVLSGNCALLPKHISLGKKKAAYIGRTTNESIASGVFWGYAGICNMFIDAYEKIRNKPFKICFTGGDSELMKPYLNRKGIFYEPLLVLKGLVYLFYTGGRRQKTEDR